MSPMGRLGDKSLVVIDAHGCPKCPHTCIGPAVTGAATVFVNSRPALRISDIGVHLGCCGPNMWTAVMGSPTVLICSFPAHRMFDTTNHCGGPGMLIEGSPDVIVGP